MEWLFHQAIKARQGPGWIEEGDRVSQHTHNQIITLYTLNLPDVICQLYLINLENKEGKAF